MIEKIKFKFVNFFKNTKGISSIELVLLILVILGIIVLFRDYIINLIHIVFAKIDNQISQF